MFATDAALAWRVKKSTTMRQLIKVDSNFTCEYDAEGYFPGESLRLSIDVSSTPASFRSKILPYLPLLHYRLASSLAMSQ